MLGPNGKQNSGLDVPLNLQPFPQPGGWGLPQGLGAGERGPGRGWFLSFLHLAYQASDLAVGKGLRGTAVRKGKEVCVH